MGAPATTAGLIRFGPFEIDSKSGELRKLGVRIKLQDQPFQILQILLEHPGEVVTREELRQRIWPEAFVDFDHGLYNAVKRLREALGDVADTPRFIETLPKRGYRFIGTVAGDDASLSAAAIANAGSAPGNSANPDLRPGSTVQTKSRLRFVRVFAGLVMVAGVLIVLAAASVRTRLFGWGRPPKLHSLAVLPLKNLSADPSQEYFSYGMTEQLITDLAQVSGLKVISHTSVIQYAQSTKSLPQIARELGVDGIVEGTVQRSGNRIRITAQLIYAPEEQHLWAASYDRDLKDVLALQNSVAAAIIEPIRAKTASPISEPGARRSAPSPEALEAYLHGNYSLQRMASGDGVEGYESAIMYFKQAIAEDPNFAAAYIKLTETYDAQYAWRPNEIIPLEKATLEKALELDPASADAHLMSARIRINYDCDLPGSEREFKETIRLNPNLANAHDQYSSYLYSAGRDAEARLEAQRAQELDPEGMHSRWLLIASGQADRLVVELRKHLELHPNDGFAYIDDGLVDAYHFAGKPRESAEALQHAWTLFGFKDIGQAVGRAYAASGYAGALRYSAGQMERLYAAGKVYEPNMIASWYARAGDKEQTLKWLKIDLADNNYCWAGLDREPDFAFLHTDPRFQELMSRMGLPH